MSDLETRLDALLAEREEWKRRAEEAESRLKAQAEGGVWTTVEDMAALHQRLAEAESQAREFQAQAKRAGDRVAALEEVASLASRLVGRHQGTPPCSNCDLMGRMEKALARLDGNKAERAGGDE